MRVFLLLHSIIIARTDDVVRPFVYPTSSDDGRTRAVLLHRIAYLVVVADFSENLMIAKVLVYGDAVRVRHLCPAGAPCATARKLGYNDTRISHDIADASTESRLERPTESNTVQGVRAHATRKPSL